jgi:hypothetical protein
MAMVDYPICGYFLQKELNYYCGTFLNKGTYQTSFLMGRRRPSKEGLNSCSQSLFYKEEVVMPPMNSKSRENLDCGQRT